LTEGVRRELLEETGLEVEVGALIEVFERIFPDSDGRIRFHFVIHDYLCRARSTTPMAGSDALEVALVHENDLERFALGETTARIIRKAFQMAREDRQPPEGVSG
jgi:ADP-ribose pyrophosphatase YjhB (NUDIX family)